MPLWNCCKSKESPTDLDRGRLVMKDANLPVIWIYGGRCSGKTTLCLSLVEKYNLLHIDCDNILRFEALRQSARGVDIMARLNRHERLPHDILVKLLREIMPRHVKVTQGYVLDNFPVSVDQGKMFEDKVCSVTLLIYIKATNKTMLKRYKKRDVALKDEVNPRSSATDMFHRPVAVHDVILQQERLETQLADFASACPDILDEYAKYLQIIDGEKGEDSAFQEADKMIKELQKAYDITDKGDLNSTLLQNLLIDKSLLPDDDPGPRKSSTFDDGRPNLALASLLSAQKRTTLNMSQGRPRVSASGASGPQVNTMLRERLQSTDNDDDPHAVVVAKMSKAQRQKFPERHSVRSSLKPRASRRSIRDTDRKDSRKSQTNSVQGRGGRTASDTKSSNSGDKHSARKSSSPSRVGKSDQDTGSRSKGGTGTRPGIGDDPKAEESSLPKSERKTKSGQRSSVRYSEDFADSTIASPQESQKTLNRASILKGDKGNENKPKPTESKTPVHKSGSKTKDSRLLQEGGFKKDERYN